MVGQAYSGVTFLKANVGFERTSLMLGTAVAGVIAQAFVNLALMLVRLQRSATSRPTRARTRAQRWALCSLTAPQRHTLSSNRPMPVRIRVRVKIMGLIVIRTD
eukprot:COSAG01_NODE_1809_length_9182_cov_6.406914_11_plen_104_part_00